LYHVRRVILTSHQNNFADPESSFHLNFDPSRIVNDRRKEELDRRAQAATPLARHLRHIELLEAALDSYKQALVQLDAGGDRDQINATWCKQHDDIDHNEEFGMVRDDEAHIRRRFTNEAFYKASEALDGKDVDYGQPTKYGQLGKAVEEFTAEVYEEMKEFRGEIRKVLIAKAEEMLTELDGYDEVAKELVTKSIEDLKAQWGLENDEDKASC